MTGSPLSLQLRYRGSDHTLAAGEILTSSVQVTFRDSGAEEQRAVLNLMQSGTPWRQAFEQVFGASQPWLCKLVTHPARTLFLDTFEINTPGLALDLGSGWGPVTLELARRGWNVLAVDGAIEKCRFMMAAARQEGCAEQIAAAACDLREIEFAQRFDLITAIGVMEWVIGPSGDANPDAEQLTFLKLMRRSLAPQGKLVIGIENRLGLKYLLGAPCDHTGFPHLAYLDFRSADARMIGRHGRPMPAYTRTPRELDRLLREAGFAHWELWAAFPDYKLPQLIAPCEPPSALASLVRNGHLVREHNGSDGSPLAVNEDLNAVYRALADENVVHLFAPSFYILAR